MPDRNTIVCYRHTLQEHFYLWYSLCKSIDNFSQWWIIREHLISSVLPLHEVSYCQKCMLPAHAKNAVGSIWSSSNTELHNVVVYICFLIIQSILCEGLYCGFQTRKFGSTFHFKSSLRYGLMMVFLYFGLCNSIPRWRWSNILAYIELLFSTRSQMESLCSKHDREKNPEVPGFRTTRINPTRICNQPHPAMFH